MTPFEGDARLTSATTLTTPGRAIRSAKRSLERRRPAAIDRSRSASDRSRFAAAKGATGRPVPLLTHFVLSHAA